MNELRSAVTVFHSGSERDHSDIARGYLVTAVRAQKRMHQVQVSFAKYPGAVQTPQGSVHAKPGDAILTDSLTDIAVVSRASFPSKYRPVPPLVEGLPGLYASVPAEVLAVSMDVAFELLSVDGYTRMSGMPGDWLVTYADGSRDILEAAVFDATYAVAHGT